MGSADKSQEEEARNSSEAVVGLLPSLNKIAFLDLKNCRLGSAEAAELVDDCIAQCHELDRLMNARIARVFTDRFSLKG